MSNLDIEKDFLDVVDYLRDLSHRIKRYKRISPKLLAEIICARNYINLLTTDSIIEYNISQIRDMFDIIILDSKKCKGKSFSNKYFEKISLGIGDDEYIMMTVVILATFLAIVLTPYLISFFGG